MMPVQETPQIFMLILALGVLASAITFILAGYRVVRGRRTSATTLLARWALVVLVYINLSVAVSVLKPRRILALGQDWCFDEWCIAVENVVRSAGRDSGHDDYTAQLRISNTARSPEAVSNFWAYLRDRDDARYEPLPGEWRDVVRTRVAPHAVVHTSMTFEVPVGAGELGFVTGHGGPTPCGLLPSVLEIGQGACLFHRPNMIRIQ